MPTPEDNLKKIKSLNEALTAIQVDLKAPKNLFNSFGKYKYRNAESICEAVKPLLDREECNLTLSDEVRTIGGRFYVVATATLTHEGATRSVQAWAREPEEKKGMDESQITGTASSYARKYALNGLFLLDDTKDPDTDEYHKQTHGEAPNSAPKEEAVKISDIQATALMNSLAGANVDVPKLLAQYKVKAINDLTVPQMQDIVNKLNKGAKK